MDQSLYLKHRTPGADDGHNSYDGPYFNTAGVVYTFFIVVYTGLLLLSVALGWRYLRHTNAIRIRGFLVTAFAILTIHIYVAVLFAIYPQNGAFACGTEFWIMSTVLPLGIAMFQASNVRLMSYARRQNTMLELECFSEKKQPFSFSVSGFWTWFKAANTVVKTYTCIGLGLVFQFFLTIILYFGSRRFSPDTGFFGAAVDPLTCRKGFEWIPSVAWQFLWAWFFGPWVLYKTRHIKDTHYWSIQTRLAIIAGIPGTPMWLGFLYGHSTTLDKINEWWLPAMWFAPGLITMQMSCVIFSYLDAVHEKRRKYASVASSVTSSMSTVSLADTTGSRKSKDLASSFQAFEYHLRHNLRPLLDFSVRCDFTSENVLFLREVRNFKVKWRRSIIMAPLTGKSLNDQDERQMYEDAANIFFELVNPATAMIPINIDSKTYDDMQLRFRAVRYEPPNTTGRADSGASRTLTRQSSRKAVAPWESPCHTPERSVSPGPVRPDTGRSQAYSETPLIEITGPTENDLAGHDDRSGRGLIVSETDTTTNTPEADCSNIDALPMVSVPSKSRPCGTIINLNATGSYTSNNYVPTTFDLHVFDDAERIVKRDVYYNIWKSYVKHLSSEEISSIPQQQSADTSRVTRLSGHVLGASQMTDAEMYDLDLELQDQLHNGVLDGELGPIPVEHVNSQCVACRKKTERRMQVVVSSSGIDAPVVFDTPSSSNTTCCDIKRVVITEKGATVGVWAVEKED